jgi:uncharacterized hydrophobic protein (TIGR00271 family)
MHRRLYSWWRHSVVDCVDLREAVKRIIDDSGLSFNYLFMTMMSAGIAVLGLLLSSPAVVIGAMLISPLMGPILGVGFGLALFDFAELRRALTAFAVGCAVAVCFSALIVLASPLQATTGEILSRTRPNLFDLLVALFAALAGTFAIVRGRGETIVGVAIATALMPPLAVIGYGLATWNLPVLGGSLALFGTNFLTIALAATITARIYGFGHHLSGKQTMMQTAVLLLAFVAMSVPLALALRQIAREALFANQVRSEMSERFGPDSRITQLDVDFHDVPWEVRAVVIAPRSKAASVATLRSDLVDALGRPISLRLNQILVDPSQGAEGERAALERANAAALENKDRGNEVAEMLALAAGVPVEKVTLDRQHQRAVAAASALPDASLATYYALERRAIAAAQGWTIEITPPAGPLPVIAFADGKDALEGPAREAAEVSAWAARRWNMAALVVPGLPRADAEKNKASLATRRAMAIATILASQDVQALPGRAEGSSFRLAQVEFAP